MKQCELDSEKKISYSDSDEGNFFVIEWEIILYYIIQEKEEVEIVQNEDMNNIM